MQIAIFVVFFSACKEDPVPPIVYTKIASSISYNSAVSGGTITDDGNDKVSQMGICWSTESSPTLDNANTTGQAGSSGFTCNMTGLSLNTTYFVRAYATNDAGTGYGNAVSFKTLRAGLAVISTAVAGSITGYTAVSGGNIMNESGSPVTEKGVCWSTMINPTTSNFKTSDGGGAGNFASNLTNLIPGTTYYLRAYATNSEGTSYGNEVTFKASAVLPVVSTASASNTTSVSALSGGVVTYEGGAPVTERGVCWSTSTGPVVEGNKVSSGTGTMAFTASIRGLMGSTTYYLRAYAVNSAGTAYGNEVSFTTSPPIPPVVTTAGITMVTTGSYKSGGSITSNGGGEISAKGICWNTAGNPTVESNKTTEGTGSGDFVSAVTGLQSNTIYYLRSYAVNQAGTSYGEEVIARTYSGTVTDAAGNTYYTTTLGSQTWMAQNLSTTKYSNGDPIPTTTPANLNISSEITPKYQWAYNGVESNATIYGRIYTWHAITDNRNVCPSGWHVATYNDWLTLENYLTLNGYNFDGTTTNTIDNKLAKALAAPTLWKPNGFVGTTGNFDFPLYRNKSGFTALPGGIRYSHGAFAFMGETSTWWLSQELGETSIWTFSIGYSNTNASKYGYNNKNELAYAVRCLKD